MRNTSGPLSQEKQHQNVYKAAVVQFLLFSKACFMLLYGCENKIFITLYIPFSIILPFSPLPSQHLNSLQEEKILL